jgi:anti-sigma regulatory factor (Ser/Thr protein kinase)
MCGTAHRVRYGLTTMVAVAEQRGPVGGFWHEAMLYADDAEYLAGTVPFIEDGLAAGEPVLVAVPSDRLALLRPVFDGDAAALLRFAPMEVLGRNPAWIIPAWADFVAEHAAGGRPARGIGEPIWAARSPDELVECGRHEALINVAFADAVGFRLLCPYATSELDHAVIEGAHRNHPHVGPVGACTASDRYVGDVAPWLDDPLPPVPPSAEVLAFDRAALGTVRRLAGAMAAAAGVGAARVEDVVLAVSEAITNSVVHGGGSGEIALWHDGSRLLCEIRDRGRITDPLAGRVRPRSDQLGTRGLWLIHQLCDLVQLRALADGQVVRLHVAR